MNNQITIFGTIMDAPDPDFKAAAASKRRYKRPFELFGVGPKGKTCRTCAHLLSGKYHNRTYHKCLIWVVSHSAATDIRLKWPACGRWEGRTK